MADDTVAPGGEVQSGADPIDVLRRLSPSTKALVISSEYTHGRMETEDLCRVLWTLAPGLQERQEVVDAVEEELRAARYPMGEIVQLVGDLTSEEGAAESPPPHPPPPSLHEADVVVTRKLRSPNLMRFESFEFEAPRADAGASADPEAEIERDDAPVTEASELPSEHIREVTAAEGGGQAAPEDVGDGSTPASGGDAGPTAEAGLKGLVGMAAKFASGSGPVLGAGVGEPTVLVADDDGRARMMYRAKLEDSGFLVTEAKDGIEAWDYIKSGAVQCAVMDMKMPGYHGLEVLGRMVDGDIVIPVVVVSAFDQLANEFVVATYPELKFLAKPAPPEKVVGAVRSLLRPGKRVET